MKITKKYYRDLINKSYDDACKVILEAIKKYGSKEGLTRGHRQAKFDCSMNSNHQITGFYYKPKDHLFVDIYWQGDDTDGEKCVDFNKQGISIAPEYDSLDREKHGRISIYKEELYDAMKSFAKEYLK